MAAYRIRTSLGGKTGKQVVYRLTVPPEIARALDPEQDYEVELTEDGILYRPVEAEPVETKLPAWAKKSKR